LPDERCSIFFIYSHDTECTKSMTKQTLKYRPEIDGLRTIAILPVILFHLGYNWVSGGFYGVDVFFVISGYLITTILVTKITAGNFTMFEFWARRVRRLLPVLLTVVLVFLLMYPFIVFKPDIKAVSSDINPAIFSYFNIYALFHFGDYWGASAEKSYFLHTWSLSVEEQFYLIYPFFLFFVHKYFKNFLIPLLVITFFSLTIYVCFLGTHKDYAFYLLPFRIWELSIGGILSLFSHRILIKNGMLKTFALAIGVALIIFSYFNPVLINNKNGYSAVFAVIGVGIILGLCNRQDFLGKILATKPFVYIGKISYSLYLWHWPIIVLFGSLSYQLAGYDKHFINLIIFSVTMLLSMLSYHFVENKTRNGKHTLKLVLALVILVVSISFYYKSDNFNIFYASKYDKVKSYIKYYDISPTPVDLEEYKALIYNVDMPNQKAVYKNAFKKNGIITVVDGRKPELMLFGDSHGVMWANVLNEVCDNLKISRSFYTANGTKPFFNIKDIDKQTSNEYFNAKERVEYAKSVLKNIETWKPKVIIIACRWDTITDDEKAEFLNFLNYLNSKSIKVILFSQPPMLEFVAENNASQYFSFLGIEPEKGLYYLATTNNEKTKIGNAFIRNLKKKYDNLEIYDAYSKMVKNGKNVVSKDKELFYFDDDHLSFQGTEFHKKYLLELLKREVKTTPEINGNIRFDFTAKRINRAFWGESIEINASLFNDNKDTLCCLSSSCDGDRYLLQYDSLRFKQVNLINCNALFPKLIKIPPKGSYVFKAHFEETGKQKRMKLGFDFISVKKSIDLSKVSLNFILSRSKGMRTLIWAEEKEIE
jgi:peptidoglycan/LPS O-acetylase OafA/YrhL